jgi:hypothetical protein
MSNPLSQSVSPGTLIFIHGGNAQSRKLVVRSVPETSLNLETAVRVEHGSNEIKLKPDVYSAADKKMPVRSIGPTSEPPVKVGPTPLDSKVTYTFPQSKFK